MLRSVKNTVLLFINMSISWWKLYDRTCQEEIKKLTCSWYMMRVHRDVEKTRNKLDWTVETWIRLFLAQRCIYTHTLIAEVNRKTNLLSWASMNTAYYNLGLSQGGILSLVSNGSWSTKLIKYHGLKAFSCKQLNKSIILVVLLCPLYSIVYAIFEKHKNIIKMALM